MRGCVSCASPWDSPVLCVSSVCVSVCGWGRALTPAPQFAFLETIVTAVTDEFPYYLRPKKAVFSGLVCVAMYLMGLVLTTDVSGAQGGWAAGGQGRADTCSAPERPSPLPQGAA